MKLFTGNAHKFHNNIVTIINNRFMLRRKRCICSTQNIHIHTDTVFTTTTDLYTCYQRNWLQLLFVVKATATKWQISKFYLQILTTEASHYIYTSQWPVVIISNKYIYCVVCYNFPHNFVPHCKHTS